MENLLENPRLVIGLNGKTHPYISTFVTCVCLQHTPLFFDGAINLGFLYCSFCLNQFYM